LLAQKVALSLICSRAKRVDMHSGQVLCCLRHKWMREQRDAKSAVNIYIPGAVADAQFFRICRASMINELFLLISLSRFLE